MMIPESGKHIRKSDPELLCVDPVECIVACVVSVGRWLVFGYGAR